ncbi:uncharacterized protein LOC144440332 [Glandiceps talaboti]
MDFAYIFGGKRTTKKPSTLRKPREEPTVKYIDKARAIAIARQLKITKVGKVTLRINSKNSLDSELPKVPLSDTRMTTRKAILEKQKGLNNAMHTKDSAVGKCILKANDYQERQFRRYATQMDDGKERTHYTMKEKKRSFVTRQRNFNQEPITSVEDEINCIMNERRARSTTPTKVEDTYLPKTESSGVYRSAFNYSVRSPMTSSIFLTTPSPFDGDRTRTASRLSTLREASREASSPLPGKMTRENTGLKSAEPSRPSTRGQATSDSDADDVELRVSEGRRKLKKRVSIADEKSGEKKAPSRRRYNRRSSSIISLIPKRSPTPSKAGEAKLQTFRPITPIEELAHSGEYEGIATDDERFTKLEGLLVPDSSQDAMLIASEYGKRFTYKPRYSHRRPKNMPAEKNSENAKKFDKFLQEQKLRKQSSRSVSSV